MKKDRKALELSYDPDEYLCTWSIPDGTGGWRALSGSVDVQPNRSPRGRVYGEVPLHNTSSTSGRACFAFPQRTEAPVLRAVLANGGTLLVLDATITYWSTGEGRISGSAALLGRGHGHYAPAKPTTDPSDQTRPMIIAARIQTTALDAVLGTAPINEVSFPSSSESTTREWAARTNPEASCEWTSDKATLRVGYNGRMRTADAFEFRLRFSPVATLQLDESLTLHGLVDEYVEPLRRFVAIATGKAQELTYLAVELEAENGWFQVFGTAITQEPYESSSDAVRSASSSVTAYEDGLSLLELVSRWRDLEAEHHPLAETYGSMLHADDQHPRSRFLLLIQALEGMHGAETRDQYEGRVKEHTQRRTALLEKLQSLASESSTEEKPDEEILTVEDRRFLRKFLMKRPIGNLDSALSAMASSLPVNGMDALKKTVLVKGLLSSERAESAPAALRIVRNDLAHGNRGYPSDDLDEVVALLEQIVRAHALRLLGCPDPVVSRVFGDD